MYCNAPPEYIFNVLSFPKICVALVVEKLALLISDESKNPICVPPEVAALLKIFKFVFFKFILPVVGSFGVIPTTFITLA